jgi:hypothetical protein
MSWIYRLTTNENFPDPLEEVADIAAICEESGESYLLLNSALHPPMSGADPGQIVFLCTGDNENGQLILHATATICELHYGDTPESMIGLYGQLENRHFRRIEEVQLRGFEPLPADVMPLAAQEIFLNGMATVRHLLNHEVVGPAPAALDFDMNLFDSVSVDLKVTEIVIGLDPTAASWESHMTTGNKAMPSFAIKIKNGNLSLPDEPLATHLTNDDFWQRTAQLKASIVCIDGPCDTNGPRVLDDFSGWAECITHSQRDAELDLFRQGVRLYWTTKNTVEKFEGASRWIARSIQLFSESPRIQKIETHPHGVFTFLWRAFGQEGGPPPKSMPAGQNSRLAILQKFFPDLTREMVPNHDAMDAAAAALVAALHRLNLTRSYGSEENGGLIWMPNIEDCVMHE